MSRMKSRNRILLDNMKIGEVIEFSLTKNKQNRIRSLFVYQIGKKFRTYTNNAKNCLTVKRIL